MPFKLKLKKTRQYNVASKSLFVISVELLDGGVADCTLSVDSSGQECLDNVCQRQAIIQPEFFGLRYINRNQQPRWVQLDRPLKRQLDKHASSHQLYLRVMYYIISGTSLITDEVTRYHYFLQLKNDLVEGRIICDLQQAVVLASYSRQAEYGNHDRERHTVEYLKNLLTFPKQMLDGGQIIDGGTLAETGRLEWLTEAVIQQHMALHNMSQAQAEEGFITTCQQLRGYGQEMYSARGQLSQAEVTIAISLTGITLLSDTVDTLHFYRWMDITNVINHKRTFSIECQKQAQSASFSLPSPEDGKYVWRMCVLQHTFFMKHREALSEPPPPHRLEHKTNFQEHGGLSESREELDSRETLEPLSSAHRAYSTSCLELAERHQPQPQPQPLHRNRALLPSYRPAPDYETAIQQKYAQQRAEAQLRYQNHHSHTQLVNAASKPLVYGSHPDIHRVHYPDVTRHTLSQGIPATDDYPYGFKYMGTTYPFAINPSVQTDLNQLHYINVYKPPPPYPSNGLASNSTPDLAVASQALNYHRGYISSHVSGSSPDLVSTRTALNRQYLGYLNNTHVNYRPVITGTPHGTYNNLPSVAEPKPRIVIDPHHISDNIQKMYDERGNIMYSMPMHRIPYQRHLVLPQQVSATQEPIYENVPLPWQSDGNNIRDRAQSLTTTDEIARMNERNNAAATKYGHLTKSNLIGYKVPENPDGHYVNAQIINRARESSLPKDIDARVSINNEDSDIDNVTGAIDKISLEKDYDETPYQSLSTHRLNNNTINKSMDNVTSINVTDAHDASEHSMSRAHTDSATSGSGGNSTHSTAVELDHNAAKEKKRRRWGMFVGKGKAEVKSATLGRDRAKVQVTNKHRWSTGLPKCQPLPPSITKETMCQILERKLSDEQLAFAFEQIPKGRDSGGEFVTALSPQCAPMNAHCTDNLPYEDNRVRLHPTPSNPHGYINASHITMTVGSSQRFYVVAAVGAGKPAAVSVGHGISSQEQAALVWECMWQVGTRLVALVGDETRPHYLPPDNTTADYGKFQVRAGAGCAAAWGASVRVWVSPGAGAAPRALWHVQFTRWPDAEPAPDTLHHFLEFLCELSALRASCSAEGVAERAVGAATAPLAFCCRAPPRAGLALAAHLLLDVLDHNQELDIPRTIGILHQQRANLVPNVHQYKFLHLLLLHYLKQSRLI